MIKWYFQSPACMKSWTHHYRFFYYSKEAKQGIECLYKMWKINTWSLFDICTIKKTKNTCMYNIFINFQFIHHFLKQRFFHLFAISIKSILFFKSNFMCFRSIIHHFFLSVYVFSFVHNHIIDNHCLQVTDPYSSSSKLLIIFLADSFSRLYSTYCLYSTLLF